jgi:hypothetical protein
VSCHRWPRCEVEHARHKAELGRQSWVCGLGVLQLGDDDNAVEVWCGGRNGRRGAVKLGLGAAPTMEKREEDGMGAAHEEGGVPGHDVRRRTSHAWRWPDRGIRGWHE